MWAFSVSSYSHPIILTLPVEISLGASEISPKGPCQMLFLHFTPELSYLVTVKVAVHMSAHKLGG
jgi:hypothetical protein